jgi:hypothetical protein
LGGLTTLPDPVAAALAKHKGTLVLNGVAKLSPAAAESLASHRGIVILNGLQSAPADISRILGKNNKIMFPKKVSGSAEHPGTQQK